ncbi:MAG: GlsB/YeaQ/YmgE family stress response membrane protein [Geminicoccaceae bacterium]|nr:GlsB/YeaQ/YmgE family stress response membrane protein [Geminicoccaceae bacterium]
MGELILLLVTGAIAGWAAGRIMRGRGFGLVVNVLLGIAGGLLGGQLAAWAGITGDGWMVDVVTAMTGAVLLLAVVDLIRSRGR